MFIIEIVFSDDILRYTLTNYIFITISQIRYRAFICFDNCIEQFQNSHITIYKRFIISVKDFNWISLFYFFFISLMNSVNVIRLSSFCKKRFIKSKVN